MKKTTLLLGMVLFILVSTAQAQSCYQGGCGGAIINVTANGESDDAECSGKGYDGAAFHCCGYRNCCVPENQACEHENYLDCVIEYKAGNFCQVDPTLDGGGYACCITTTTTTSSTTTSTIPCPCYAPCGNACVYTVGTAIDTLATQCPPGSEPIVYECPEECYCDPSTPYDDIWGQNRVTAEGTCKPEIPSPEFSSLAILLTALLTAPAFAYLIIKKRH